MKRFPAVFWCEVDDDFLKKVAQCAKTDLEKTQIQLHVDSLLALQRYGGESRMDYETRKLLKELVQRRRDQVVSTDTSAKHKEWDQYYRLHCMEKMSRQIEAIMSRAQLILKDCSTDSLYEHLIAARREMALLTDSMRSRIESDSVGP